MTPLDAELADLARPGWIPLVILIVMFIAVFFLGRSMRKMLRTIDPDLPHRDELADAEVAERGSGADETPAPKVHAEAPTGRRREVTSPVSPDVG